MTITRRALLAATAATAALPAAALAGITVTTDSGDPVLALAAECQQQIALADELYHQQSRLEEAMPASLTRGVHVGDHLGFDLLRAGRYTTTQKPIFAYDADALRRIVGVDDARYPQLLSELRDKEAIRDADPRWQEYRATLEAAQAADNAGIKLTERIIATPAATLAGAREKARLLEWLIVDGWDSLNAPLVRSLVADLERLTGRRVA